MTEPAKFHLGLALIVVARRAPGVSYPHAVGSAIHLADAAQVIVELFFEPGISIIVEPDAPNPYVSATDGVKRTEARIVAHVEQIQAALALHRPS